MTMTELPPIREALTADAASLERELGEIDLLVSQARAEAARHEAKRAQAADKLTSGSTPASPEQTATLITLTRRAALMEAQVDILEAKRRTLARFRDALIAHAEAVGAGPSSEREGGAEGDESPRLPPAVSRIVLSAQEDLRREIARAMHDGPAQSLTNIVLQAQIVDRLLERDPELARSEIGLLISMVQQTLDATKSFIFDVRPMVLDDLGLVPTLRRAARERGRRAGIPVEFDSIGGDRRLAVDIESGLFRILDEALAAYLSVGPHTVSLRLDWSDDVIEATIVARRPREPGVPSAPAPEAPASADLPAALASMVADRRADEAAVEDEARRAAIAALPAPAWREIQQRAETIGATAELLDEGGTLRVSTPVGPGTDVGAEEAG